MVSHLGVYCRDLRLARGLTTRQVAQVAGCSNAFVTMVETGVSKPGLFRLWQLIEAVGGDFCRAVYLMCLDSGIPDDVANPLLADARQTESPPES